MTSLTEELAAAVKASNAATTREQLGAVYDGLVGYDLAADDPTATIYDLRDMCLDFVREVCYANGIHVSLVGIHQFAEAAAQQ